MNYKLIAAVLWFVLAAVMLVYHTSNPDAQAGRVGDISAGWIALALGFYNLARWWFSRGYDGNRTYEESQESRTNRARYSTIKPGEEPRDPNFDFSREPPARDEGPK